MNDISKIERRINYHVLLSRGPKKIIGYNHSECCDDMNYIELLIREIKR